MGEVEIISQPISNSAVDVGDQLHALVALAPGKQLPVPIIQGAEWNSLSEQVWTLWE
jgi:hypothetical protein